MLVEGVQRNMGKANLLIADDDKAKVHTFSTRFKYEGYDISYAYDGQQALASVIKHKPDLVLIDYKMPKLKGTEAVKAIREIDPDIPIIIMTCYDTDQVHIESFEVGSDDYVRFPIDFKVLLAHVERRLRFRQKDSSRQTDSLHFADVELNIRAGSACRGDRILDLTTREYKLLLFFLRHPRQVLSRDQIIEQVWGYDFNGDSNVVETCMSQLRKKLEGNNEGRLIYTKYGMGYVLQEANRN